MNREAFLAKVREAAAAGRRFPVHVRSDVTRKMGYAEVGENLVERYAKEIAAVGGRPVVVDGRQAARDELTKLLRQHEPRSAICWRHSTLDRLGLAEILRGEAIEAVDYESLATLDRDEQRAKILATDVGITSATCAVAETGSLLMAHGPRHERVASLTPPVHVAVVERYQIVADLFDAFDQLAEKPLDELPSNVTFITGPSKTGDIEMNLVTGVHGPGKFYVILIDAD